MPAGPAHKKPHPRGRGPYEQEVSPAFVVDENAASRTPELIPRSEKLAAKALRMKEQCAKKQEKKPTKQDRDVVLIESPIVKKMQAKADKARWRGRRMADKDKNAAGRKGKQLGRIPVQ